MKNKETKKLRLINRRSGYSTGNDSAYLAVLGRLAIAESNLVKAGKDSALPHFIAIVKEIERLCDFAFEL
jgi:hypothetical protein